MEVPKLRFNGFSDDFQIRKLCQLTKIYDGTHQTPKYVERGVPFYSVEHVTANQFEKTKYVSEEVFFKENKRVKLEKGDILMTRIGSIGVSKYIDWNVRASFYVSLALIKNNSLFDSRYLNQYINSNNFQKELWKRTIHVAFPQKINLGEIGQCNVKFPSLTEQQKIASFLTAVDKRINLLQRKATLLEDYKKGVMQKLFSQQLRFKDDNGQDFPDWEEKKLGEVAYITSGKSNRADSSLIGEYTFFDRSQDIRTSDIFLFDKEAVIVAGEGSDFPPKYFKGKFDLHQRTYAIMDFNGVNGKFLFYSILKNKSHFIRYAVGSTVKSLRLPIFKKMKLNIPCKEEQQKIASFLESLDKKIATVNQQIEGMQTFKKGLLQQMFV
mgnify:CR=1 FL=1